MTYLRIALFSILLVPAASMAVVEKMWPDPILMAWPTGAPGFPVVPMFEPNHISYAQDGSTFAVSTLYDLRQAGPHASDIDRTFRLDVDGNVNIIGTSANRSDISGDGTRILYRESGGGSLLVRDSNDTNQQTVRATGVSWFDVDNTASRVAYVSGNDVYTSLIDGTGELRLHETSDDAVIEGLAISGDGSRIIFIANPDGNALNPDLPALFVVDNDGANKVELTDATGEGAGIQDDVLGASISDDGNIIVYAKSWNEGVYSNDATGNNEDQLVSFEAEFPVVSGDGATVAFISDDTSSQLGGAAESGLRSVYSFPIDRPSAIRPHTPFSGRTANVDTIGISGNGNYVFYTSSDEFGTDNSTRDFRSVFVYRSTGTSAPGATGEIAGGIGTEVDPTVTALNGYSLLLLAVPVLIAFRKRRTGSK